METAILGIGSRVKHKEYGMGVVIQVKAGSYIITFIEHGNREIVRNYEGLEVIDLLEQPDDMISFETVEQALTKILRNFSDVSEIIPIADKWRGGKLVLQPANHDLKAYEMPITTFFNKIIMLRDRLRVLEQKVNASNISEEEKISIQQYITRSYGSLTSFNILFRSKADIFVGESSKDN